MKQKINPTKIVSIVFSRLAVLVVYFYSTLTPKQFLLKQALKVARSMFDLRERYPELLMSPQTLKASIKPLMNESTKQLSDEQEETFYHAR